MRVLVLLFCAGLSVAERSYHEYDIDLAEQYFEDFVKTHNKQYANESEKSRRFDIFVKNLESINQQNMENDSAVFAIDATSLQHYYRGILKRCKHEHFNHVILFVGYGKEGKHPYWVIKNSWGEEFGEDGYVRIKRGVNACGIAHSVKMTAVVV